MKLITLPYYCGGRFLFGISQASSSGTNQLPVVIGEPIKPLAPKEAPDPALFKPTRHCTYSVNGKKLFDLVNKGRKEKLTGSEALIIFTLTQNGLLPLKYLQAKQERATKDDWGYWESSYEYRKLRADEVVNFSSRSPTAYWEDMNGLIPYKKEDFYYLLYHLLKRSGAYAFVHAVTNNSQKATAEFLEKIGFTVSGKGAKPGGAVCTNWIGDQKVLSKNLEEYKDVHNFMDTRDY